MFRVFNPSAKILVVDDSANHRQLIVDSLRRLGFKNTLAVADVNAAFSSMNAEKNKSYPYDLVLSDLNMPGLSGLDFLRMTRETPGFEELPFILITTESEKGAVIQAATNGVSSYIVKPFSADILAKRMGEAWRKHYKDAS